MVYQRNRNFQFYLLLFSVVLLIGCSTKSKEAESLIVKYWVRDLIRYDFPQMSIDTVFADAKSIKIGNYEIPLTIIEKVNDLDLNQELFELEGYHGFYWGKTEVGFKDSTFFVSRFLISDNKELNRATDVFYTKKYGIIMKKYHGYNYELLDRIMVKEGNEEKFIVLTDLIQGIFYDDIIFPEESRN